MTSDSAKPIKQAESDRSYPIGIDPSAYEGDIVSRLRHWRHRHLAHCGELFEAAAGEIERLRTVMCRIVDEDCTVAIQGGTFYADDEPLFAITDTNEPRNGAVVGPDPDSRVWETPVHTPATQTTRGECSTPREGTSEPVAWWLRGTEYDTGCEYEYVSLLKENAEAAAAEGGTVVPLYRAPTLTDAEREAVTRGAELADHSGEHSTTAAALRGLLKRLK